MSRKIVAGNWKMNLKWEEAKKLLSDLGSNLSDQNTCGVIVAPPACYLSGLAAVKPANVALAAQNCHSEQGGAYTGEISAPMLASIGVTHCLVGHSERRDYFCEANSWLAQKVDALLSEGLVPIYCCGEKLDERKAGNHFDVVQKQLEDGLFHLADAEFQKVIIAYEPVWAIGTGETATSEQAQEIHAFIRKLVADKYGDAIAATTPILYGGSCKPSNADELFAQTDVDGGLIGGAALKAGDFSQIVKSNG